MLLSRVAERLYWAARYLERAEGTARIVREHSNVIVDLPLKVPPAWEHLLGITGGREAFDERYAGSDETSSSALTPAPRLKIAFAGWTRRNNSAGGFQTSA